ncbi:MAG: MarR family transcriptional regulator [Halothiobacillus sp.]|nr:MarR family transcriptional regulator [Halothiobacillus sp.]
MKDDSKTTGVNASALQVFRVLDVLMRHFAHGLTPGDLIKATGISGPNVTRYVATLEAAGYAERIPETGRIRPSVRFAQMAVTVMADIDRMSARVNEIKTRLTIQ